MAVSNQLDALAKKFEGYYGEAKTANLERYAEAKNLYETNLSEAGNFGAGMLQGLEQQKTQFVGQSVQGSISAGLAGVQGSDVGSAGLRFEREYGGQARGNIADMQAQRVSGARKDLAGVIERREDEYPDFSLIANLYERAAAAGNQQQITLPPLSRPGGGGSSQGDFWAMQDLPGPGGGGGGGGSVSGGGSGRGGATNPTRYNPAGSVGAGGRTGGVPTEQSSKSYGADSNQPVNATASLMNQYNRYAKGLKRTGIGENSIADYATWWRANYSSGATKYLSSQSTQSSKQQMGFYPG